MTSKQKVTPLGAGRAEWSNSVGTRIKGWEAIAGISFTCGSLKELLGVILSQDGVSIRRRLSF
jgi:hypothetical protein